MIEELPVAVFCPRSNQRRVLESLPSFTSPDCGAPAGGVLEGKELEVFGFELQITEPRLVEVRGTRGMLGLARPALGPNSVHGAPS